MSQVLSNKAIQKKEIATPSNNPPPGYVFEYFKSDGSLYIKNSAGVELELGDSGASLRDTAVTTTFATSGETINCTANTFTVNLPTAVGIQGTTYTLVNSGTGVITLDPIPGETINLSSTIDLAQYTSRTVQSDNANWIVI